MNLYWKWCCMTWIRPFQKRREWLFASLLIWVCEYIGYSWMKDKRKWERMRRRYEEMESISEIHIDVDDGIRYTLITNYLDYYHNIRPIPVLILMLFIQQTNDKTRSCIGWALHLIWSLFSTFVCSLLEIQFDSAFHIYTGQ